MELVGVLRVLARHRVLVLVAVLLGCAAAVALHLKSRQYHVGVSSVTALVDTPRSQVVDLVDPTGNSIASLSARASLLANLMTSSPIKDEIAARSGIGPNRLTAVQPVTSAAGAGGAAAPSGSSTNVPDSQAYILKASIPNLESGDSPIIAVDTQAPTAAIAARMANQSIAVLKEHLSTLAGADRVPDRRRVVVTQLGAAESATVTRGPSPALAVAVGLLVALLGCVTIVAVIALAAGWRRAAELERADVEGGTADEFADEPADDDADSPLRVTGPAPAGGEVVGLERVVT